jgi:putative transposase
MARKREDSSLLALWQEASENGKDALRETLRVVIQGILEEEISAYLGAQPYERTGERRGYRNGYKPRMLRTRVGGLEIMVPKDRDGNFQTELFERYQRSEKALVLAIAQMYVSGVSTRKVKAITEALCGLEISRSQVSVLTKELEEEIEAWRNRSLEKLYPYLVADARYEKVRHGGHIVSKGVLIVVGVSEEGEREILGTWVAHGETEASWSQAFEELKERGLRGVRYVVSDDDKGLRGALERNFPGVLWQRCQVHFVRNVLGHVRRNDRKKVLALLRGITESPTAELARRNLGEAVKALERDYPKVSEMLEEHGEEILTVYALPDPHRRKMRTTNMLERLNQELKRRTRVVRIFPDDGSCLRLGSALAMEANEEWEGRKYLDMEVEGMLETAPEVELAAA